MKAKQYSNGSIVRSKFVWTIALVAVESANDHPIEHVIVIASEIESDEVGSAALAMKPFNDIE